MFLSTLIVYDCFVFARVRTRHAGVRAPHGAMRPVH
jgi:hypothetical protein